MPATLTLRKEERLCSKKLLQQLFQGGQSRSMAAFPVRMVYLETTRQPSQPPVTIMISVPKRCLKHAVDRNRVKRQVREAYRKHKHLLTDKFTNTPERQLALAFIWLDRQTHHSTLVEKRMTTLLERMSEQL
jgi:ribonuclease P protein component